MSERFKIFSGVLKFLLISISILLVSCTGEKSEVTETNGYYYIKPRPSFVSEPRIVDWKVGPLRRQSLSKGFSFKINLPYIEDEHLQKFIDDYQIDSWIIGVRRRSSGVNKSLEHFYVPLIDETSQRKKGSSFRINQKKYFVVKIYYADAALSSRFEQLMCPGLEIQPIT